MSLWIERYHPLLIAVISVLALVYLRPNISLLFKEGVWSAEGLYSAIFGWSSIQSGFAFGVYGFVIGRDEGFVKAIKDTVAFERFISYTRRASYAGFFLAIISIPLIVSAPDLSSTKGSVYFLVSAWFGVFVWTFISFLRLAFNFGKIASVKDRPFHGA